MELNIKERLGLLELLPREENYAALKELRKAREVIALTPDEIIEFEFVETPTGHGSVSITWNTAKEREKDIPLDEYVTTSIQSILSKLDKEKKLSDQTFSLFEKFVTEYR